MTRFRVKKSGKWWDTYDPNGRLTAQCTHWKWAMSSALRDYDHKYNNGDLFYTSTPGTREDHIGWSDEEYIFGHKKGDA